MNRPLGSMAAGPYLDTQDYCSLNKALTFLAFTENIKLPVFIYQKPRIWSWWPWQYITCIFEHVFPWCSTKRNFYIGHNPYPQLPPGLQSQRAHDFHFSVLTWLEPESNLTNSSPSQIILKADASKPGWGAYRNLVSYIVLVEMYKVFVIKRTGKNKSRPPALRSP